jgi:hypothetical protein
MKAILEFNLPEDDNDLYLAINAKNIINVLWELDQHLRSNIKYADDSTTEDTIEAYQKTRDKLHELVSEYNININI